MTCYKGGVNVRNQHQMCDVTSMHPSPFCGRREFTYHNLDRKILDMLPDRPPQVTFSCDASDATCAFQFWIGKVESFYCALDKCISKVEYDYNKNTTQANCEKIKCSCIPGRMLCGEDGSVSKSRFMKALITVECAIMIDIDDFLDQEIKGPAKFSCTTGAGCKFEEPAMNVLINDIFGDKYITLECTSGECLHYTQVPGYIVRYPH